jgi:hypothetical protein
MLALHHGDPPGGALSELLVGSLSPDDLEYAFPVLPWAGVFLASTAMGEQLHRARARGLDHVARQSWLAATVLLASTVPLWLLHRALSWNHVLWRLTMYGQKMPPGPMYLALYGGCGCMLLALFVELERRGWNGRAGRLLAMVGRCSLFAFVAQYAVYYTALQLLRPSLAGPFVVWLTASVLLLVAATAVWDAIDGNRWITVGLWQPVPGIRRSPVRRPSAEGSSPG